MDIARLANCIHNTTGFRQGQRYVRRETNGGIDLIGMRNGSLGVLELRQHAQMALLITPMALEPLMEYEAVMMLKCCPLPHTMKPTLLDPLQQRCCNNVL